MLSVLSIDSPLKPYLHPYSRVFLSGVCLPFGFYVSREAGVRECGLVMFVLNRGKNFHVLQAQAAIYFL